MSSEPNHPPSSSGRIEALFWMAKRGHPTTAANPNELLDCVAGFGIQGDVHAHRLSPRQILITLQSELDELHIAAGALYENMVISLPSPDLFKPGAALVTDRGVEIKLTMFCEPCKRIAPVVADLGAMINRRGVLGTIEHGGMLKIGDAVKLVPGRYAALPESAYQRFLDFVPTIPAGKVVRYLDVTIAIGVAPSFVRAVPAFIKRSIGSDLPLQLPLHRIVNAQGALLPYLPNQAAKLAAENVQIDVRADAAGGAVSAVDLASHLWTGQVRVTSKKLNPV